MSKHHRHAGTGDNVAKLKSMRAELAASYSLPETDPRIGQAALVKLNQRNWESQVLLGRAVPATELEAYSSTIATLLGQPPKTLEVRFVEGFICPRCQADTTAEAEAAKAVAEAAPIEVAPADTAAPLPQPAPNVVPLKPEPSREAI